MRISLNMICCLLNSDNEQNVDNTVGMEETKTKNQNSKLVDRLHTYDECEVSWTGGHKKIISK